MEHQVSPELANAQVSDLDGKPQRVGDLWSKRTVLLLFVRHFG